MSRTLCRFLTLVLLGWAASAQAELYQCKPDLKTRCYDGRCETEPHGSFEHAEVFSLQTRSNILLACLWTDCYEGQAQIEDRDGEITTLGLLNGRDGQSIAVTLSIDRRLRFTALWQLTSNGVTLDSGICTLQE